MTDFDSRAREWDSNPARMERANAVAAEMRKQLQLSSSIKALEYGCGTGLLSFALQPYLGQITLADSSSGMLDVLQEKIDREGIQKMQPLRLDLAVDPVPADRFDLIYNLMVLHHIPDTDRIINSFWSLLKPGGILCIADLDEEDGSFHGEEFHGHLGFNRSKLAEKLTRAGFQKVRFSTAYQQQKQTETGPKSFPLFLAIAEKPEIIQP